MNTTKNPLLCDPETGSCELPSAGTQSGEKSLPIHGDKLIRIIYFTDPICSSCWGIEPQLRKLKLEYGDAIKIEYRMGGLLPDWNYNSGGISKPADVAKHWDEVSLQYAMPIDGDLWLEDPLHSSFPPSIAFKAAQLQDQDKAIAFLREIREMVFLQKKNITKWEHLEKAATNTGLDLKQFKQDVENTAIDEFNADLQLAKKMGVRGFPTLFFTDQQGRQETVYGAKPYTAYEATINKLSPGIRKTKYSTNWEDLFRIYPTLTLREFSELSTEDRFCAEQSLNKLWIKGKLIKTETKNGSIWKLT